MDDLKSLLDAIDVEYFLDRESVTYKRAHGASGPQFIIKDCPVCGSNEWKVYCHQAKGLGNCFSGTCNTTFNKYSLIKAYFPDKSNAEFRRYLAQIAGEQGWRPARHVEYAVVEHGGVLLPDCVDLPFEGRNIKYLMNRGITSEVAQYFHLKYCKLGYYFYLHEGERRRQNYSMRVIIPIYDLEGQLISFQGRDITGTANKKYLFPPGISTTGRYIYNAHNAIGAKTIVLCEGVFDCFSTKIAIDQDPELNGHVATASFGKSFSAGGGEDQLGELIKLKRRGLKTVVILWDKGENRAAVKTALAIAKTGIKVRVASLKSAKDPNEATNIEIITAIKSAKLVTRATAVSIAASS